MRQELKTYYSTVAELLREEKLMDAHRVFTGGDVASYVIDHDNWDGGIDFYIVEITIDVKTFVKLRTRGIIEDISNSIETAFNDSMKNTPDSVRRVSLIPSATTTFDERKISEPSSYWKVGYYKVFISHVSKYKTSALNLKLKLEAYGISAFVAHVDIQPSKEWEVEIEKALFSMNALCAILTPDFNSSKWCDQEVGYALGRNVLCVPIDKGLLPYGMFGKIQAIKSDGKNAEQIAESIFQAIINNEKSRTEYIHTLTNLILNNRNEKLTNQLLTVLLRINGIEQADFEYIHSHINEIATLISTENIDAINTLFIENELQPIGTMPLIETSVINDSDNLPF